MAHEATRLNRLAHVTVRQTLPSETASQGNAAAVDDLAPASIADRITALSVDRSLVDLTVSRWRALAAYQANARSVTAAQGLTEAALSLVIGSR